MISETGRSGYSARDLALKILIRVHESDAYADRMLESDLRRYPLPESDRSLTTELVYGVLRWQGRLDWVLRKLYHGNPAGMPYSVRIILRLGLYQLMFLDRIPTHAAVNESVRLAKRAQNKKWGNVVNGMLRRYSRLPDAYHHVLSEADSTETVAEWMSHPEWLIARWLSAFGFERTLHLCEANNMRPPIGLRINRLKTDLESVTSQLQEANIPYQRSDSVPDWLTVRTFCPFIRRLVNSGLVSVQDGSAALVAHLVNPQPGEHILDMAAAPGGKTAHLAELSHDQARIVALDRYFARVRRVGETLFRLGIHKVIPVTADARKLPVCHADKILLDAPCSGMGVIRRRAELRWRMQPDEIDRLIPLQRAMLDAGAAALPSGGVLVYSTCTVCQEENSDMITWFLSNHREFEIESADSLVAGPVVSENGTVETWPDIHGLDGSFAVRMRKKR